MGIVSISSVSSLSFLLLFLPYPSLSSLLLSLLSLFSLSLGDNTLGIKDSWAHQNFQRDHQNLKKANQNSKFTMFLNGTMGPCPISRAHSNFGLGISDICLIPPNKLYFQLKSTDMNSKN